MKKMTHQVSYTIVSSGSEAMAYLKKNESKPEETARLPRLVLLDINLVGMSGLDLLKWVRGNQRTQFLPVVAFSTSDNPADIEEAYAACVNAYVIKPGSYQVTGALLQRICDFWLDDNLWLTNR